jgi:hypothetical protein
VSHARSSPRLGDEGGDGAHAVGEDDGADAGDEDGEDALQVRDRHDVPVPHRAARRCAAAAVSESVNTATSHDVV